MKLRSALEGEWFDRRKMSEISNHRIRVARERRERMRARLLNAVTVTCANRRQQDLPTVDDVISQAGVSRATFYKYFNSVEEAMNDVGRELIDDMIDSLAELYGERDEGLFRLVTSVQLFLLRSVIDPLWAAFVSRTAHLARDTKLVMGITGHLEAARRAGVGSFTDSAAAASLVAGAVLEGIRHMARTGQRDRAYVDELSGMILRGVGIDERQIANIIRERTIYIRGLAPDRLPWWRDPWTPAPSDRASDGRVTKSAAAR